VSFDRLAPHYRWMEFFSAGELLQRCRLAHLNRITGVQRALILGEGNGRFLVEFLARHPLAEVTCVDSSQSMLSQARERVRRRGFDLSRIAFTHADALDWRPSSASFELVVTHFFLDCFPPDQLGRVVSRAAEALLPGGCWLLADFCEPPHGLPKWRARLMLALMYAFFRRATALAAKRLTPPDDYLQQGGLSLRDRRRFEFGLLHSDVWEKSMA
jgi:ubiquinone/menaquinone biosynthesis C-methylase UbiE